MIEVRNSKSGLPYALYNDIALNSQYDPLKEAERFLLRSVGNEIPGTIIILGAGLGYVSELAQIHYPFSKLINIWFSEELYTTSFQREKHTPQTEIQDCRNYWHPGSKESLISFLYRSIHELDIEGLKVLEWKPEANAFPELSLATNRMLSQIIRELSGSLVTTERFGRRWIKNLVHNFSSLGRFAQPLSASETFPDASMNAVHKPIFIAASGPSLTKSFPIIARQRDSLFIIALPSSIKALLKNDIIPDLVVQTDPGNWASFHLHELSGYNIPIAMPLSACRGAWRLDVPILPLIQHTFLETSLFTESEISGIPVLPNGTVAATAFEVAELLTRKSIIFGGLDFCYEDIKPHVSPHTFDIMYEGGITRKNPYLAILYRMAIDTATKPNDSVPRSSLALRTYAGWFNHGMDERDTLTYRVFPSPVELPGLKSIDGNLFEDIITSQGEQQGQQEPLWSVKDIDVRVHRAYVRTVCDRWLSLLNGLSGKTISTDIPSEAFKLLYYINTRGIIELRKKMRLGTVESLTIESMAKDATDFLLDLKDCIS